MSKVNPNTAGVDQAGLNQPGQHRSRQQTSGHKNSRDNKAGWIGWALFTDVIDGLRLTFRYMFSKGLTMQYPDKEKWIPYPRHRGHPYLTKDNDGEIKCVACELCANICPSECITVIPYEDAQGKRHPKVFDLDSRRCMYCGLCEDACPVRAIALGSHYEYSCYDSKDMILNKEQLLALPGRLEQGGYVTGAKLHPGAQVVAADDSHSPEGDAQRATPQKDWWQNIRRQ